MNNYTGKNLEYNDTELYDLLGSIGVTDLQREKPEHVFFTKGTTPLIEKLIHIACKDVEENITKDNGNTYFGAGRTFGASVFTRDICYSGILALNEMYPDIMKKSLEFTREIRRDTAFKIDHEDYKIEGIEANWIEVDNAKPEDFRAGCITRRTDDVVFIWGAADWIEKNGNKASDWQWLYEIGVEFFEDLYKPFYDATDGLYFGQASFIDVHFPTFKANGYPLNWSISDCCRIKALSTNCLYKLAMDKLSKAANILQKPELSSYWSDCSESLKIAINKELTLKDGSLAYYKDKNGTVTQQREALGTALAVLSDVVTGELAESLIRSYEKTEHGFPLIVPPFDHSAEMNQYEVHYQGVYHNETSWPFVDALFCMAYEKATGEDIKSYHLAIIARTCRDQSSFREVTDFNTSKPFGSHSQLWTAAAFLNVCLRENMISL